MTKRLLQRMTEPTPTGALVAFRVALGTVIAISSLRFLAYGWVTEFFVQPTFFFKYWGFGWVKPLPAPWIHAVWVLLGVLGVCFATGLFYRVVAPLTLAVFLYVNLVDVTNWLNHYYLVALLLLLGSLMPLGRAGSLDARLFPKTKLDAFPAWCTWLLRFQVGVVYVNAGLAKLNSDWLLHAQPLNIWLNARTDMPILGALFDQRATAYFFSWFGFLFDTFIVGFLLWRRTRMFAYAFVVAFHVMTGLMFPIGMFPWIMMASALVFMDSDWPARLSRRAAEARAVVRARVAGAPRFALRPAFAYAMAAFCVVQLAIPFRSWLYGGNVSWHEQGMRFSWKVMTREKNGSITYIVEADREKRTWYVSPRKYLTDRQERELSSQPDLILQLAHHVREEFEARGYGGVRVRVEALVSLNGRPAVPMIDPTVDLSRVEDGLGKAPWILPAPEGPPIHLRPAWSGVRVASRKGS
ncbi:MAG: HTTM domain-containing protein [Deltaproteobacteria bacterium]|nr:HTTM domain-containing protein [Deltaproteobacteria bacterium]